MIPGLAATRFLVIAVVTLLTSALPLVAEADDLGDAVRAATSKADPSIVRLRVIGGEQIIDGEKVTSLVTTGIVINAEGDALTSQFAVQGKPDAVLAETMDGQKLNAEIVATDHVRRLVLLKIKGGKWQPLKQADPGSIKVGQWSVALGRFYSSQSSSISVGIISALGRVHGMAIQSDAKISPVNYGGPLINLQGEVTGILVPLSPRGQGGPNSGLEWYDSGIGFAIPLKDALASAERMKTQGDLKAGRIGLQPNAASLFAKKVTVERVLPGGPAEKAGLQKGDQILKVNGRNVERVTILQEVVASSYAGDLLKMDVLRGDQTISAELTLVAELPARTPGYLGVMSVRTAPKKPTGDALPLLGQLIPGIKPEGQPPELPRVAPEGKPEDEEPEVVNLLTIDSGPAKAASLPVHIELAAINDQPIKSLGDALVALQDLRPDTTAKIGYRLPGSADVQSSELSLTARPSTVAVLGAEFLKAFSEFGGPPEESKAPDQEADAKTTVNGDVQRRELEFEGRGRCIVFESTQPSKVLPGVLIHLSAQGQSEDQLLQKWRPYLSSHRLMLMIPVNPDNTPLTGVDIPLIMTGLQAVSQGSRADLRRLAVIASRDQAGLAWQASSGGPSPIRGIVLTDGWFAGNDTENVEGIGQSVLLLDSSETNQAQALLQECRDRLGKAGFWVPRPALEVPAEKVIADWMVQLRAF